MGNKDRTFSRLILIKNNVKKRVCSLHLGFINNKLNDLYIEFKHPLTLVGQGILNKSTGRITTQQIEMKKIQHLHYVIPQHKLLATYREKGEISSHSKEMYFKPNIRDGKYLQWFLRLIPQDRHLAEHKKKLTNLDLPITVPKDALNEQFALDFWLGVNFDPIQRLQMHNFLPSIYKKNERQFYASIFGEKDIYAIYVVMCLPKNMSKITTTRLIIPKPHN